MNDQINGKMKPPETIKNVSIVALILFPTASTNQNAVDQKEVLVLTAIGRYRVDLFLGKLGSKL